MWKWLFWKAKSENLKLQNFGRVRSIEQNDRWFRSYMTQKSFKILYEFPLWLCFLMYENDKMIVLRVDLWNFINIEFLVFQIAVLKPSLFYAILQKGTWEGYMYFLILKETFLTILTLIANVFSWCFDKVKIIKFKSQTSAVNPTVNHNFSLNSCL